VFSDDSAPKLAKICSVNTDMTIEYESAHSYAVTAGIGAFNGSMVPIALNKLQSLSPNPHLTVMPYATQATIYNLVMNPLQSISINPVSCAGDECQSYLLTGGLYMTTPWPSTDFSSYPLIKIENVIGRQIDYRHGLNTGDSFENDDCKMYSDNGRTYIAMKLCIAKSKVYPNSSIAGK
jgi:hypothetical protein